MKLAGWTLTAVLFAGTALAQQAPVQGTATAARPGLQALQTYLNLTDDQVTNLKAVETSLRSTIKPLFQNLVTKRQALRAENQKTTPDPTVITQLNQDIANLLSEIEVQRDAYRKQALAVLTTDQLAQLDKLTQALLLVPVGRAAVALDLISAPQGFGGMRGPAGAGLRMMMRRQPAK